MRRMRPDGRDVRLEDGSLTWVACNYRGGPRGGEKERKRGGVRGLRGVVGRGSGRAGRGVAAARKCMEEGRVRVVREEGVVVAIAVEVGLVRRKACSVGGGVMQDGACERRHSSRSIGGGCRGRSRRVGVVDAEICGEVGKAEGWRRLSGLDGWGDDVYSAVRGGGGHGETRVMRRIRAVDGGRREKIILGKIGGGVVGAGGRRVDKLDGQVGRRGVGVGVEVDDDGVGHVVRG